ncbi:MAG: IPTL-CTERM sorting domain-containing protein [Thermodesulfobacteriota bacterium]
MRHVLNSISFLILTMIIGAGFLAFGTGRAMAGTAPCAVGIEKVAIPDDDTPFEFIVSGDQSAEFTLQDPSNPTSSGGMGIGQTVTITEEVPPGWVLESIECIEGVTNCGSDGFEPCLTATVDGNSVTFFCEDNDTASCVFTNVREIVENIPTLSEWGLISLAVVIGIAAVVLMRKRKAAA